MIPVKHIMRKSESSLQLGVCHQQMHTWGVLHGAKLVCHIDPRFGGKCFPLAEDFQS